MTSFNSQAAILSRLIKPETDDLSPDAARSLLRLRFDESDLSRMDELAARAREGALTEEERSEVENYERVGHLLALLHSKARRALSRVSAAS
jgi:hypothetical protein